jgi:hypothetical protein
MYKVKEKIKVENMKMSMRAGSKGIELNMIAYLIIGIIGVALLLIFIYGPLNMLIKNGFCYFYQGVLGQRSDFCGTIDKPPESVEIAPETKDELARYIAAYSILCWRDLRLAATESIICNKLWLTTHPGDVTEENVTKILEMENGCNVLENSMVVDKTGNLVKYRGSCGLEDDIYWDVGSSSGYVIGRQSLIEIKYDIDKNKIVVKA